MRSLLCNKCMRLLSFLAGVRLHLISSDAFFSHLMLKQEGLRERKEKEER